MVLAKTCYYIAKGHQILVKKEKKPTETEPLLIIEDKEERGNKMFPVQYLYLYEV